MLATTLRKLCYGNASSRPVEVMPPVMSFFRMPSRKQMDSSSHANRVMDMALEDGKVRGPLAGFFPATLPVPTLEQALAPFAAGYPHLHADTGRSVKLARKKAKKAQVKYTTLTLDECIAVVLYTIEEHPRETSLYYLMNAALRSKQRAEVWPWRDFIWLLLHALRKLPPVPALKIVFRGCTKAPSELGLELEAGFEFTWAGFSSTATTQGVMSTFVGQAGPRTLLTIALSEPVGRDVRDFSLFPKENEVLFPPNMCFEVVSHFDAGGGLIIVQCKQTETIDAILDMSTPPAPGIPPMSNQSCETDGADVGDTLAEAAVGAAQGVVGAAHGMATTVAAMVAGAARMGVGAVVGSQSNQSFETDGAAVGVEHLAQQEQASADAVHQLAAEEYDLQQREREGNFLDLIRKDRHPDLHPDHARLAIRAQRTLYAGEVAQTEAVLLDRRFDAFGLAIEAKFIPQEIEAIAAGAWPPHEYICKYCRRRFRTLEGQRWHEGSEECVDWKKRGRLWAETYDKRNPQWAV